MRQHGVHDPFQNSRPSEVLLKCIYALYWKNSFLGSCVAISDNIVISAGHHYNAMKDDVGDFSILVKPNTWIYVEYGAKNSTHDILVLWLCSKVVHFTQLRGFLPPPNSRVATVWLSLKPPHEPVISPGVVVDSDASNCIARGTVSTTGSSGAPVVDTFGDHVVGLHLTSNTRNGSRVSGFIHSRKLVTLLAEMGIVARVAAQPS
ncbi:unnamed protein product [Phytomonas sp. EM1]|nr:unnamed protein product [Phytomonas sp. EM1]|eukprot:CCW59761.1 unnamed protein product [Phytomonas sp. isolate EM1]